MPAGAGAAVAYGAVFAEYACADSKVILSGVRIVYGAFQAHSVKRHAS